LGAGGERGAGSTATPLGGGGVGAGDVETTDYVRALQRKVHPFWEHAFPKSAILEGRSGLAIVAVVIASDGTVVSAKISRPSGVPEFDENVRQAVLAAGPYGALPRSLSPRLSVALRFHALNPAVRPKLASD
jgi:TonB family protein